MNVLSSLRSRIFLTSGVVAVLAIAAAIYLVSDTVTREAENALKRELTATGAIVNELRTTRAQTFTTTARLIADAPRLKAAVATNDPPTVQDLLANDFQNQLGSNLLLVTDRAGEVLATVGIAEPAARMIASQPAVRDAAPGHETTSLIPEPDGMLQLVTVPIVLGLENPEFLGTLSVGFLFDQALARQLKEITGSEIAFGMNGEILATTLPADTRHELANALKRAGRGASEFTLGGEDYVALPLPLVATPELPPSPAGFGGPGKLGPASERPTNRAPRSEHPANLGPAFTSGDNAVALVLRSRTEQLRFLRSLHTELAVTAVVAAGLAMLLSFAVARTITRPLAAITGVMREVAATGDLTRKIVLGGGRRWEDEDARLLAATFNTLTDSVARFQREMAQRERLSSLGRLSTVIAHEVRNPLMIIKAALHGLRQPGVSAEAVRDAAADIDGEVARLNRIVNEVLDFARPIRFQLSTADLNALCRESATAAQATPGAAVQLDLEPSLPPLTTDVERLRLALVNLIVNARHAVESQKDADGGRPRVFLSTRLAGNRVAVVVADTGAGIDSADRARVFDPYFTTKRGGTGLGLPIAKNIIEGLGGTIAVASAAGRGTEIRIELPVSQTDAEPAAAVALTSPSARPANTLDL
jgi:signal transduction histidine kinase